LIVCLVVEWRVLTHVIGWLEFQLVHLQRADHVIGVLETAMVMVIAIVIGFGK